MPILEQETFLYPDHLLNSTNGPGSASQWQSEQWDRRWWLVYTKARQEKALARNLLAQEIGFYLPLVPKDNMIRGRRVRSHLPLFGGYMFLFADESERENCLKTNRVSQMHLVGDPEGLRGDLLQVDRLIRANVPLTLERRLTSGQHVQIRTGPFKGTSGILLSRRGDTKLLVAVNFIGQGVSIEIDDFQLEAVA